MSTEENSVKERLMNAAGDSSWYYTMNDIHFDQLTAATTSDFIWTNLGLFIRESIVNLLSETKGYFYEY